MASQHIEIKGNETRLAGELRSFIDQLRHVMNTHGKLLAVLDGAYTGNDANGLSVRSACHRQMPSRCGCTWMRSRMRSMPRS